MKKQQTAGKQKLRLSKQVLQQLTPKQIKQAVGGSAAPNMQTGKTCNTDCSDRRLKMSIKRLRGALKLIAQL